MPDPFLLAEQQAQQGRLARSVRPDQADAVAAHDHGRKTGNQAAPRIAVADILRLDHLASRVLRRTGLHAHVAGLVASLAAFAAHRFEPAHAAFVARAAGLDALADPDFFLGQLLVEQRIRLRFGVQAFFAPAQVVLVVAGPTGQGSAIDLDDARRQRTHEAAIVGDEDDAAGEAAQEILEPGDRLDVEMIGRFVEQQHVRIEDQRPREQDAALHAARERVELIVLRQFEPAQHLGHASVEVPAIGRLDARLYR